MKQIARLRRCTGISQHELARASGVPRWRICFFETNRIDLRDEELKRIKEVLERRARDVVANIAAA
jgi:predicted transcriptional regulator